MSDKPPRPITKTEFKELPHHTQLEIIENEAARLEENCLPDILKALAKACRLHHNDPRHLQGK